MAHELLSQQRIRRLHESAANRRREAKRSLAAVRRAVERHGVRAAAR